MKGRVTASDRQAIEDFRAELATRFATRCCRCGEPAIVVIVGQERVIEVGIVLSRAKPDQNLCASHAGLLTSQQAA